QVQNPLIYLLAGAAALSLFVGHAIDAAVIAGIIVLNTLLGFFQEWRAEGALDALRRMTSPHARVLRDGSPKEIDASMVVPGDILILETGNRVAATARVTWSEELEIDESALTGESLPVGKSPETLEQDIPLAEQKNMVHMSTSVTGGRGQALVVATGMNTEIGRIAAEVLTTDREDTPLQKKMNKLSTVLGIGSIAFAAGVFGLGLLRGYEVLEMLMFSVALAVSAIPEGLPAVISVTLALGVQRMAGKNAIIRRMPAVETLGSTTVICTDKTGTITKNQMTVQRIWAGGFTYRVSGEGYAPEGEITTESGEKDISGDLTKLLEIGLYCNNALLKEKDGQWSIEGNPSDGALVVAAKKAGMERIPESAERLSEIPFSSSTKYMAILQQAQNGTGHVACVKGAPERILEFCSHVLINGAAVELDDKYRSEIAQLSDQFASEALRVLGGAYRDISGTEGNLERAEIEGNLTFAGLWGMIDPPREESIEAVKKAKAAGIRPVMITGDHAVTALAIANAVGISDSTEAVTGKEIDGMEKHELARAALERGVFARVTPSHKLKIMESLKEQGHIVAMTGDGVNDAPALKGADIGVAMGITGTEVAKEAADMILMDDNFATIVQAVEEGRVIYNNLQRVVFFLLVTNLGEILTLVAALVIGLELPLTAVMILWVNLVTDGTCTVPLGMEPGHADILKRPPRDPKEFIIDRVSVMRIAILTPIMAVGTIGLFWYANESGGLDYARTIAFTTLAAFQWFQAFNARSSSRSIFSIGPFTNRWVLLGVGSAIIMQIGAVQSPLGHMLFNTVSLSLGDWLLIFMVSSTIFIADELMKIARKTLAGSAADTVPREAAR
ncbi:MAG: HAD-IC family P-type ATPase, partial [Synergistaceae bacterium]|nr:HAD-IC family P-type ATPase [Synergistaceae bacterium]